MGFTIEAILNLTDALVIIVPAILTIFLALRIKNAIGPLRILTTLLALFLIIHGLYHFVEFYNIAYNSVFIGFLGETVIQPLSWIVLVAFSTYYLKRAG
jgi:hypothetical protein